MCAGKCIILSHSCPWSMLFALRCASVLKENWASAGCAWVVWWGGLVISFLTRCPECC